ncbi:sugar phosphate isomerase/epimerase family protein [Coraliomargarita parva]|uniref:sugar phosphate isomerase/epimerase family protein n=1 Tax=Coraliomargarita parva TaxID=3014050 RepID=UPI0022B50D49|nr:TIM barrel protein [Coraliomargarita parva]
MTEAPETFRPFKLCFSSMGWPEANWAELSTLARQFDFGAIELRTLGGELDIHSAMIQAFGSPESMRAQCDASGVGVVGLNSSWFLLADNEAGWQDVQKLAHWAERANIPYIRVFDGKPDGQEDGVALILKALEKWEAWKCAAGIHTELLIETHDYLADWRKTGELAERFPGKINILWDVCHSWRLTGRSPLDDWAYFKPFTRHIHIKDALLDASSKNGVQYVLPGEGALPIVPLLEKLTTDSFDGVVSLEWEKQWHPDLPSLKEALESGGVHGWWPS